MMIGRVKCRHLRGVVLLILLVLFAIAGTADEVTIPRSAELFLESEINEVPYKLYVSVPEGYDESKERYPVLYLLDADYSFAIAHNITEHLSQRNHLRPLILVAIAYDGPLRYKLNRTRDYTPTHSPEGGYGPEYQKVSGGAPLFLRFIEEELIPFMDDEYRTIVGDRALSGHSYGGLFTSWVFLTRPELFNRYIAISPSLWYDDEMIFEVEEHSRDAKPAAAKTKLYLGVGGDENAVMPRDLRRFATLLEEHPRSGVSVYSEVLEGETHNSVYPAAFSRGLRWAFDGR